MQMFSLPIKQFYLLCTTLFFKTHTLRQIVLWPNHVGSIHTHDHHIPSPSTQYIYTHIYTIPHHSSSLWIIQAPPRCLRFAIHGFITSMETCQMSSCGEVSVWRSLVEVNNSLPVENQKSHPHLKLFDLHLVLHSSATVVFFHKTSS